MELPITPPPARRLSSGVYAKAAADLKCEEAAIRAVVAVEARSVGFDSRGRVLILNERHVLYRRTSGKVRQKLVGAGLARKSPGGYPKTQDARYAWLEKVLHIAGPVAFECISMGFPQIMGFNARRAGYSSAKAMYEAFAKNADEHIAAMVRFIAADKNMVAALRRRDWAGFARLYNGSAYRRNRYDEKLADAYRRFGRGKKRPLPLDDGLLDRGDKGPAVRALQNDLRALGFTLDADGDFGPMTEQTVRLFQRRAVLKRDGIAGPKTLAAIRVALDAIRPPAVPAPSNPEPEVDREERTTEPEEIATAKEASSPPDPKRSAEDIASVANASYVANDKRTDAATAVLLAAFGGAVGFVSGAFSKAGDWIASLPMFQ